MNKGTISRDARWDRATRLVWAIWIGLLATDLYWVGRYVSKVPLIDEWLMVPAATGQEPATAAWLWSEHNEHRFVLVRLLLLGVYRLTGTDFRAGAYINVLGMAALAAVLIVAARRARGRIVWADACLPLALMHFGQSENFLWSWQLAFVLPTLLAGTILYLIVSRPVLGLGGTVGAGVCLVALPLCGGMGLGMVPALSLWLVAASAQAWRSPRPHGRRNALVGMLFAGVAWLVSGLYFVGFQRPPVSHRPGLATAAVAAQQFLSLAFGMVLAPYWYLWAGLVAILSLAATAFLIRAAFGRPAESERATGLLAFIAAIVSLSVGVGWGRVGFGLASRYITLACPLLAALYFAFALYAPLPWSQILPRLLCLGMAVMLVLNTYQGVEKARWLRENMQAFEADVRSGTPGFVLADHYSRFPFALFPDRKLLAGWMAMLREAGVGVFRELRADPVYRELPLNQDNALRPDANTFVLKQPRFVYGVSLRYQYQPTSRAALFQASWTADGSSPERRFVTPLLQQAREDTLVVWVNGPMSRLTLTPDNKPYACTLGDIRLLVPPSTR